MKLAIPFHFRRQQTRSVNYARITLSVQFNEEKQISLVPELLKGWKEGDPEELFRFDHKANTAE